MMTLSHKEQQAKGLKEGMTARGIGKAFHYRTLREEAPDLFETLDTIKDNAREGRGIIFEGGLQASNELMLVARALYLSSLKPFVIRPTRLIVWLEKEYEDLDIIDGGNALCIPAFSDEGDAPFTRYQQQAVENYIDEWLDSGRAFYAQVSGTISGSRWWSESFKKRLQSAATVRVCGEPRADAPAGNN